MFTLGVFLLYFLFGVIAMVLVGGAAAFGGATGQASGGMVGMLMSLGVLGLVLAVIWLGLLIPSIAVAVRRLHDTSRSGLWLLLYVVPYVVGYIFTAMGMASQSTVLALLGSVLMLAGLIGAIVLLVFLCLPSTVGPNRYGPDPLAGERTAVGVTPTTY